MRKMVVLIMIMLLTTSFTGCLNESTVSIFASEMEEKYDNILSYRATIIYTESGGYAKEYVKTMKKPDKIKEEYLSPERIIGDQTVVNGNTQLNYDASKQKAYTMSFSSNYGESKLNTPDFLSMLLILMNNANVQILDDDVVGENNATVILITPKTDTTFSKMIFWLDKETFFILKSETYDIYGDLRYSETTTNIEINIEIDDIEFELPEGTEVINPMTEDFLKDPETFEDLCSKVGFTVLAPFYLPDGFSLNNYGLYVQRFNWEPIARITYWPEGYANPSSREPDITVEFSEDEDPDDNVVTITPSEGNAEPAAEVWLTLYESLEDILDSSFGFGRGYNDDDLTETNVGDTEGKFWVRTWEGLDEKVFHLSWHVNDYWLLLCAYGRTPELLDSVFDMDELVKIAESLTEYDELE